MDLDGLAPQQLGRADDEALGRLVQRGDLVEHQFLVGQGLRDEYRGPQRRHGRGARPVHTFDQFEVVAPDQLQGQVTLRAHRELGEQVLVLLPHVEQDVLAKRSRPIRVGGLDPVDPGDELGVEVRGELGVLAQPAHGGPQVVLFLLDCGVVPPQFLLAVLHRVQNGVQMRL